MKKFLVAYILIFLYSYILPPRAIAAPALGIHLLDPNELPQAIDLVEGGSVTVVLRSDDHNLAKWQQFFDLAADHKILPIVRLATSMDSTGWRRPNNRDIIHHAAFLSFLDWHRQSLPVIVFNEPNHGSEWGGAVDPVGYADILGFAIDKFHAQRKPYLVLPAGLDAAAPNGSSTMDSFTFLSHMFSAHPDLIAKIDAWNSHSYPNPGFVGSPHASGKNSVKGFESELAFLKRYSDKEFDVYITETGWRTTPSTSSQLAEYYQVALSKAWNHDNIKAITPFVFAAHSGPFAEFSFTYPDGTPTPQYLAWKQLKLVSGNFAALLSQRQ